MINRFQKIINIKYSRIFKFIFFIRYLFLIFFTATILFLLIPKFFDYKKREAIIFQYLQKNYGLEVRNHDQIKYNSFPIPHFELSNVVSNFYSEDVDLSTGKLLIYPEFLSLYNYEDFKAKKIKLKEIKIITEFKDILNLYKKITKVEKKIALENLSIQLNNLYKPIINLQEIKYSNFGYNRYNLSGKIFKRNFQVKFEKNLKKVDFELKDVGIFVSINFLEKENSSENLTGNIKGKILKSNFKSDFTYNHDLINIENLFFRDKNLSLDGNGIVYLNPYFKIDLSSSIENINTKLIKKLKLNELLYSKNIISKINFKNNFVFKPNKFNVNLVENLSVETNLNYGRLAFKKKFSIANSFFSCNGDVNLLDEFPVINFNCSIKSKDKKKLLKKFKINYENHKEPLELKIIGNLNILNNKMNFSSIKMNKTYSASNEDLKYFKEIFESIIFDQDFINIFSELKIRKLILEIL